jgi:hypothetical protein
MSTMSYLIMLAVLDHSWSTGLSEVLAPLLATVGEAR